MYLCQSTYVVVTGEADRAVCKSVHCSQIYGNPKFKSRALRPEVLSSSFSTVSMRRVLV